MAIAIRLSETGGPQVLKTETLPDTPPGSGEVWLQQEAIEVNFLDITQRNGAVPIPLPGGLGLEATGRVVAVGADVTQVSAGHCQTNGRGNRRLSWAMPARKPPSRHCQSNVPALLVDRFLARRVHLDGARLPRLPLCFYENATTAARNQG